MGYEKGVFCGFQECFVTEDRAERSIPLSYIKVHFNYSVHGGEEKTHTVMKAHPHSADCNSEAKTKGEINVQKRFSAFFLKH